MPTIFLALGIFIDQCKDKEGPQRLGLLGISYWYRRGFDKDAQIVSVEMLFGLFRVPLWDVDKK